jgi:hypothetical protein
MKGSITGDAMFLVKLIRWYLSQPRETRELIRENRTSFGLLDLFPSTFTGFLRGEGWSSPKAENAKDGSAGPNSLSSERNPLEDFFWDREEGRGIWKWAHYFEVYHRHFARFVGTPVTIIEIGIYSGGSLEMWRNYFGSLSTVYGIDIKSECKTYEDENVKVLIGDQADRGFWKSVREKVPTFDIVIDDGGHTHEQQMVTLEETLPYLSPGGVYLCEDIHNTHNRFAAYVHGLGYHLNGVNSRGHDFSRSTRSCFQREVHSIHLYPYLAVIEKTDSQSEELFAPKRGTKWQPFAV